MRLGAHTHLPLNYDCQEADQHTTMHQSTTSQLARLTPKLHASKILIVLLLAITKKSVRLMNVNDIKLTEIAYCNSLSTLIYTT